MYLRRQIKMSKMSKILDSLGFPSSDPATKSHVAKSQTTKENNPLRSKEIQPTKEMKMLRLQETSKNEFIKMGLTWYRSEILQCIKTIIDAKVNNLNLKSLVDKRDIDPMLVRSIILTFRKARKDGYEKKEIVECWGKVLKADLVGLFKILKD